MRFNRARYVTLCQQSLVTGAVLVVGISAAGVKTLDIVPQPGRGSGAVAGASDEAPFASGSEALTKRERTVRPSGQRAGRQADQLGTAPAPASKVDVAPVTPVVREVEVTGIAGESRAPRRTSPSVVPKPQKSPATQRLVAQSAPQQVSGYATVGVTWRNGAAYDGQDLTVQVRTQQGSAWSGWSTLGHDEEDGPDAGSADLGPQSRPGTDALVIGEVDRVQMRAETTDGSTPPDLKLAVIDPGVGHQALERPAIDTSQLAVPGQQAPQSSQQVTSEEGGDTIALSAMKTAPQPTIFSRAQWGANEKLRDQTAPDYGTVKAGFIHHTVNANGYTADQVPALLRGIYAYHTQSRGWRDIGYNYLVDRFGRIWEGRYGGITKAVVGAHTLGYNELSFAMSAIGNYDIAAPPQAVLTAYAKLFAWKLSLYGIRADATRIYLKDRYVQAINGHRDVGQTACPGRYLYAKIPYIRSLAQRYQDAAQGGTTPPPTTPTPPPTPTPAPTPSTTFTSPTQLPLTWRTQTTGITFPRSTDIAGSTQPDLVLKRADGLIQVLPTGGQVGFGAPVGTPGHWSTMNLVTAVGDVTGDGRGDVLARLATDGTTRVYRGDGAGHVTVPGVNATTVFAAATSLSAAGDWNRDGRADVLMKDRYDRLWMVPGLGSGRFGRGVLLSRSWGGFRSTAVAGDLTGDGRPDVVGIHSSGNLYLRPQTATGALGAPVRLRSVGTLFDSVAGGSGDLTGDRIGDIVVRSSRTGQTAIIPGLGGGRIGPMLGWFTDTVGLQKLSAGQVSGTSSLDLVGVNAAGTELVTLRHNGLVNLRPALASTLKVPGASQVLNAGDWNRDGKADLITREGSGDTLVLRPGLGNGRYGSPVTMARGWRSLTLLAAVGDVTGDKVPDLAGRTARGMTVFPGNGRTGFLAPRTAPSALRTFNLIGSGSWAPATSRSAFVAADGSFVPAAGSFGGNPSLYDWVVGPGDVDGDGVADLVVRDSAGTLWLQPGTAKGVGPRRLIGTGFAGYRLGG